MQYLHRKQDRLCLDHGVEKLRLIEEITRSGFVERRRAHQLDARGLQVANSLAEILLAIAKIRTEPEKNRFQNRSLCIPRDGLGGILKYSNARRVPTRPRGVRSMNPSCIKYGS